MALGASLLEDVLGTIQVPTGSYYDGTPESGLTYGSALNININKLTPNRSGNYVDHSGGQDLDEWMRIVKRTSSADLEFMWGPQSGPASGTYISVPTLQMATRVKIIAATTVGTTLFSTVTIRGVITDDSHEYAGPSTGKITIKACGGVPLITTV